MPETVRRDDPSARVAAAFERIRRTRMEGLAFLNGLVRVEAVGFRPWQGQWLGALVTPWCLNLLLTPGEGEWAALPAGGERFVDLPAGRFRFIANADDEAGEYHACSLFSPVHEFADHDAARATAEAALVALFDAALAPAPDPLAAERASGAPVAAAEPAPVSKRDFLRGRFPGTSHVDRG
jgi:[NiFe] hydrogenase assembly HybE family chaperone